MVSFKRFIKRYNNNIVLNVDNLKIPKGIHWIKGENGSGKTTLFKSLAGLLPYDGDIIFNENISAKKNPISFRRIINYCEAEPNYPGFLTGKDLIYFTGKAKGSNSKQMNSLINEFGVDEYIHKSCQTYSSGMLKKASLAIAFLGNPQLIILDEPLITLDEQSRNLLFDRIYRTHNTNGTSFLISSHQPMVDVSISITNHYLVENKTIVHS